MSNLYRANQSRFNDRYCKTIPNNDINAANKYLLVHNHRKDQFAPFHNFYNHKSQSKLSFYGFQSLQSMPKATKYRYNDLDEETLTNMSNKKRNDYKLQIIEERINNLESRNAELEQSNRIFFNIFNEVVKSHVYKNKYITRNLKKFKEEDQHKIKQMMHFANDPHNEFDAEGKVLEYKIPGILNQIKLDITKLIDEKCINNNSSTVFYNTIDTLKKDIYKDIDNITGKQKEHIDLLKQFVNYNSSDKQHTKKMMRLQEDEEESLNKNERYDIENEEKDNDTICNSRKRRKKRKKNKSNNHNDMEINVINEIKEPIE